MELNNILDGSIKLKDHKWVKEKILEYNANTATPTFRGLLCFLGFTRRDLLRLNDLVSIHSNKQAMKTFEYLEKYKNMLEAKMEEWIIYNGRHPDLEGKFINYNSIQWALERANPELYKPSKVKEKVYELKNDSGYSLESKENE